MKDKLARRELDELRTDREERNKRLGIWGDKLDKRLSAIEDALIGAGLLVATEEMQQIHPWFMGRVRTVRSVAALRAERARLDALIADAEKKAEVAG